MDTLCAPTSSITASAVVVPFQRELPAATHRVLHVINGEHYAGAERVQDLLALGLPEQGIAVGLAALKPGKFADVRRSESPLYSIPMTSKFDLPRVTRELADLVRAERYDVLHAHTPRTLLVATLASLRTGTPVIYHVHSPAARDSSRWLHNRVNALVEAWCLRRVQHAVVVAPSLAADLVAAGFPSQQITCVPNGVPHARHVRQGKFDHARLTLGMVALFRPRKGTEVLLEALAAARSHGYDLRVRLIGGCETPEYEVTLRSIVARLDLEAAVEWTGFTTNVGQELLRLDAMVLPSLYGEGLPMVVLEAMAAGVPVIASRVEGATLAIAHERTGLLVEPASVSDLTNTLVAIARGDHDLAELAAAASECHAERFSDTAMCTGLAAVYRQVLAPR